MIAGGWLFLAAYTASGLAGLIYEVSWTRLLTLHMGHTTAAASTVVAAFMGGLAGGAALGGRVSRRLSPTDALRTYVALELLVVLVALALPFELEALSPLLRWAYADGSGGPLFPLVRLGTCLVLLMLPALALGGTFPMAVRWFVGRSASVGRLGGLLYAANTAGAALGATMAGFVLMPAFGLSRTVLVGAGASLLAVAAVVIVLRRQPGVSEAVGPSGAAKPETRADKRGRAGRQRTREAVPVASASRAQWALAAAILGLTGFATLTYEIVWMRVFALTSGPSTYAFAGTIASVIAGLAIGSVVGAWLAGRTAHPALALAAVLALTALVALWAAAFAGDGLPRAIAGQLAGAGGEQAGLEWIRVRFLTTLVVPIAIGLGLAFPLALQLAGAASPDQAGAAPRLGAVYAVNAVSSVIGSLAAGFVTIPLLGLQRTLAIASGALVLCLLLLTVFGARARWARAATAALAVVVVLVAFRQPPWNRALLASGVYKYAPMVVKGLDLETALTAGTLLYYRDGAAATVSVKRLTGELSLSVDGKVDASTSVDMLTQKALAHLPLLLHPNPRAIAIVGLGSGVTLASALVHPVTAADVVEISPEVVEASTFFAVENHHALDDPRTRLILGDGRSHLQLATRQYDVIISEPSNPWMAGVAALFTREFLLAARARLSPGGILCQWAHTYNIGERDLRSIVATFASVFPNGTLWLMGEGDLLLVGSASPDPLSLEEMANRWRRPGVAEDLRTVGALEPFAFLSSYIGGGAEMRRYADHAPVQTDDRMALEFSAPRALYGSNTEANIATLAGLLDVAHAPLAIAGAWRSASVAERRHRADMLFKANAYAAAYREYAAAFAQDIADTDLALGVVRAAVPARQEVAALMLFDSAIVSHPGAVAPRIGRSKLLALTGGFDAALVTARDAAGLQPVSQDAVEQLASLYADAGDAPGLASAAAVLRQLWPTGRSAAYYTSALQFLQQDFPAALGSVRAAIAVDAHYAPAHNLLGAILASLDQTDQARAAFRSALAADPRDPTTYANLGRLELTVGHAALAAGLFSEALSLDPSSDAARQGLAQASVR